MEKKVLNEINRISELMGTKMIISEQPTSAARWFRKMIRNSSDDVLRQVVKSTDNLSDDAIRKLRGSLDGASDDVIEAFIRQVDYRKLGKSIIDNGLMGSNFTNQLDLFADYLLQNPGKTDIFLTKMDGAIDNLKFLEDASPEVKSAIKQEARERVTRKANPQLGAALDDADAIFREVDDFTIPAESANDIPSEVVVKQKQTLEQYQDFIRKAQKNQSPMQYYTPQQFEEAMQRYLRGAGTTAEREAIEYVVKKKPTWWSSLPMGKKILWVFSMLSVGPTVITGAAQLLLYNLGHLDERWQWWNEIFSGQLFCEWGWWECDEDEGQHKLIKELTKENVIEHISNKINVPKEVLSDETQWYIKISNDKKTADVEEINGSRIYKVTLDVDTDDSSNNRITSIEG